MLSVLEAGCSVPSTEFVLFWGLPGWELFGWLVLSEALA